MARLRENLTLLLVLGAIVAFGIVLATSLTGPARPDAQGVVEIEVDRYEFDPAVVELPTDEPVTLRFVNRNDYIYHLTFGQDLVRENGRATGFATDLFADVGAQADPPSAWRGPTPTFAGTTISLAEGSVSTITVTVPEDRRGTWHVGCFVGRGCDAELQDALTFIVD